MSGMAWTASDCGNSGGYVTSAVSEADYVAMMSYVVVSAVGGDVVAAAMIGSSG